MAHSAPTPVVSAWPVVVPAPGRGTDLHVRVSAPAAAGEGTLPLVLFSHGFGSSLHGYAPLAEHWAARGFVVVQPTHLDSRTLGVPADDPRTPRVWRIRIDDLVRVLDGLDTVEQAVPGLRGRVDRGRIAVAGHSWGAQTASTLLGARVLGADGTTPGEDLTDGRVRAGVLLALAGLGDAPTPLAAEHFPFMRPSFAAMRAPALIVAGDKDLSRLTTRGPDWFTDGYVHSPGPKSLLTLHGAEHSLGGVPGYEAAETTDESPARVGLIQRLSTAYLRSALDPADPAWPRAAADPETLGGLGELRGKPAAPSVRPAV
ncbi:alpha/beta hydrolase family protein [Streptomyces sp. NPDC021224]|uniref:alpha/beta hydrolase family protein n=1 Tax=unclassified Streptomyces TaxID=2593676 RepID=UPI00379A4785